MEQKLERDKFLFENYFIIKFLEHKIPAKEIFADSSDEMHFFAKTGICANLDEASSLTTLALLFMGVENDSRLSSSSQTHIDSILQC